ncbi:DUF5333 domain-containing protein [Roseobacter sp. N2S]|uniref:DUF5333 domain-containing protein n=1 Tax=Roseobacter sp. N2S TaxID=2663844 RepID=UPI00285C7FD8|nr:DUF5333 domain-containing protein [Roseobacter sp. N2S]MDR6264408.1 hypothetical protein [Roseobacter sp. N2S]
MRVLLIAALTSLMASTAMANPPLREVKQINDGLLYVGLADEIRKTCDGISGRIFKGIGRLRSIHRLALDMGYSKDEIETFVDDRAEKNRLKARGKTYLKANGASQSDPQSMCALGRKEIAKQSEIGTLLYEN